MILRSARHHDGKCKPQTKSASGHWRRSLPLLILLTKGPRSRTPASLVTDESWVKVLIRALKLAHEQLLSY